MQTSSMLIDPEYLTVRAEDVHPEAIAGVRFQRALRLPEGTPPYNSVRSDAFHSPRALSDIYEHLSFDWLMRSNQHLICLLASESVTLEFASPHAYPFAIKVSIGGVDALSGEPHHGALGRIPQDYIPMPCQNWIDAWQDGAGATHDFIAPDPGSPNSDGVPPPLDDESDSISVQFFPMKAEVFRRYCRDIDMDAGRQVYGAPDFTERFTETHILRGRMRYEREKGEAWDAGMVYPDPFEYDDWDIENAQAITVTMVRPAAWGALTGEPAGDVLFDRGIYEEAGVPWLEEYGGEGAVDGS